MKNLEPLCARWGRSMIEASGEGATVSLADMENTITKALGVLAENGLYAMGVFLLSCHKKEYGERLLTRHLAGLWQELDLIPSSTGHAPKEDALAAVAKITGDLPRLILARKVTELAMVFARYHAKAEVRNGEARP